MATLEGIDNLLAACAAVNALAARWNPHPLLLAACAAVNGPRWVGMLALLLLAACAAVNV